MTRGYGPVCKASRRLQHLGLGEHAYAFAAHEIDLEVLTQLEEPDLLDVGVHDPTQRLRLLRGIEVLLLYYVLTILTGPTRLTRLTRLTVLTMASRCCVRAARSRHSDGRGSGSSGSASVSDARSTSAVARGCSPWTPGPTARSSSSSCTASRSTIGSSRCTSSSRASRLHGVQLTTDGHLLLTTCHVPPLATYY